MRGTEGGGGVEDEILRQNTISWEETRQSSRSPATLCYATDFSFLVL